MHPQQILATYPGPAAPLSIAALAGCWHVVLTSLPFWRTRRDPSITYTRLPAAGPPRLLDDVRFTTRSGRERHVLGVDVQDQARPQMFHWRGLPWYMGWLKSDWCFLDHDPAGAEWALTYFSPTAFTPAGIDIYGRMPDLDPALVAAVRARLRQHADLARLEAALFAPGRAGASQSDQ